jgi:hypothetical protein
VIDVYAVGFSNGNIALVRSVSSAVLKPAGHFSYCIYELLANRDSISQDWPNMIELKSLTKFSGSKILKDLLMSSAIMLAFGAFSSMYERNMSVLLKSALRSRSDWNPLIGSV